MRKVCFVAAKVFPAAARIAVFTAALAGVLITAGCLKLPVPAETSIPLAAPGLETPSAVQTITSTHTALPAVTLTRTPLPSPTPEPGCQAPSDDYTRVDLPAATLNMRTYAMLQYADSLYEGPIDLLSAITQGSYTNEVEASFGTHSGGGAVDLSVIDTSTWTVLEEEIEPLIRALRLAGFAAWLRRPDELYPGSPIHIHALAVGDEELSYTAYAQVYDDFGYLAGMNGLPPAQGEEPHPDAHGGPVICDWMDE